MLTLKFSSRAISSDLQVMVIQGRGMFKLKMGVNALSNKRGAATDRDGTSVAAPLPPVPHFLCRAPRDGP